jgi:hypothetical protein
MSIVNNRPTTPSASPLLHYAPKCEQTRGRTPLNVTYGSSSPSCSSRCQYQGCGPLDSTSLHAGVKLDRAQGRVLAELVADVNLEDTTSKVTVLGTEVRFD